MTRCVLTVADVLQCYHVEDGEKILTTVAVMRHNCGAQEFAEHLRSAARWFDSAGEKLKKGKGGS